MCTQTKSLPSFFFTQVIDAFVFFRIVVSAVSLGQKEKGRLSIFWVVHHLHRVKKSHLKTHAVLSGAWPIYRSGSDLAGPDCTWYAVWKKRNDRPNVWVGTVLRLERHAWSTVE